jgi:GntR family transcriptional regulator
MSEQTRNVDTSRQLPGVSMTRMRKRSAAAHSFLDPFPKYLQIREILVRRIEREMRVGDQLPTEHALCQEFGVSRETVRDALSGLEADGLISRTPGHGTFVARLPSAGRETRLTGLTEDFSRFKLDTEARVLFKGPVLPQAGVADVMDVPRDEMVYRIFRVRHFERQPFGLHEAFLPLDVGVRVASLDLGKTSIVHVLRSMLKLDIWEDHQRIEAMAADTEVARLLEVGIGAPVLHIVRHFKIGDDQPIVLFRSHYRADRYYYTVKLAQPDAPPARDAEPRAARRAPIKLAPSKAAKPTAAGVRSGRPSRRAANRTQRRTRTHS